MNTPKETQTPGDSYDELDYGDRVKEAFCDSCEALTAVVKVDSEYGPMLLCDDCR